MQIKASLDIASVAGIQNRASLKPVSEAWGANVLLQKRLKVR